MNMNEIFTFENLYDAYKNCRKSKQHKGEVIRFETNLSANISNLIDELVSKKYKLGKYKEFLIYEPKERLIEALPFKDRVVIRCFCDVVLKPRIEKICNLELRLELNEKTQIGLVSDGIDFLGYRHILNSNGKIIRKLRASSKIRLKNHLKTLERLKNKNIVDEEYVYIRKNAFYNHIKDTNESQKLKMSTYPKNV